MNIKRILAGMMCLVFIISAVTCAPTANAVSKDLTDGIKAQNVKLCKSDKKFKSAQADFAVKLFQNSLGKKGQNTLVSPTSVMYALAMTANGAKGKTLKEMEKVLGNGMSIDKLNKYLGYGMKKLPKSKELSVNIANSIWYDGGNGRVKVRRDFLQKNVNFYKADVFDTPFNNSTVKDINSWVNKNTDGMVKKIVNKFDKDTVMCLINAITFDGKWAVQYDDNDVSKGKFTAYDGTKNKVKMMNGTEYTYIKDDNAKGFMKPYKGGQYSFAALLPDKNVNIYKYIKSLTGSKLSKILSKSSNEMVITQMPKFKYDYSVTMKKSLNKMGIVTAFHDVNANFKKLAKFNPINNVYINNVVHKTHIQVDKAGTKAAAATAVIVDAACAVMPEPKVVKLNRPFIYMIVDNRTNLPVFIGCVANL